MRKFVLFLQLSVLPAWGYALGLGEIDLNSGLNEVFDARIELISPSRAELDTLNIRLADAEAFARAGIDRAFILSRLQFEVVETEQGADYIRITTREPIREPFLNFLIEASWSNGRLFREYTVLLDPPLYDPEGRQTASSESPAGARVPSAVPGTVPPARPPSVQVPEDRRAPVFTGAEYGPVSSTDTLWSIAGRTRPDSSVSIQQMMLALLRANPDAFIGNNINGLKWGQILQIPDRDEVGRIDPEEAVAETRSHNAVWDEIRVAIAGGELRTPGTGSRQQPVSAAEEQAVSSGSDPELRLLAPGDRDDISTAPAGTGTGDTDITGLTLADEQLQALSAENRDLRDRLAETETLIEDLRRLIDLKDDELATLQKQLAAAGLAEGDTGAPAGPGAGEELVAESLEEELPAGSGDAGMAQGEQQERQEQFADEEVITGEEETAAPAAGSVTTVQTSVPAEPGVVGQILEFITANLVMVGGAVVALLVLAGSFAFARKRRSAADQEETPVAEFPDFDSAADETEIPGTEGPEHEIDIDNLESTAGETGVGQAESPDDEIAVAADTAEEPETAAEDAAPAEGEAEEDLLAEVNVFLAYEHYDQAEEFVRDAIKEDPENLDYHGKLLEVFYSSGDKRKYEEEARVLHDLVNGEGTHWEMAQIMWQEMSPNRPLFAGSAEEEEEDDSREDITGGGILDLTGGVEEEPAGEDTGLDFDLGSDFEDRPEKTGDTEETDHILDVTTSSEHPEEDILDVTAAASLDSAGDDGTDDGAILAITAAESGGETAGEAGLSPGADEQPEKEDELSGIELDEPEGTGEGGDEFALSLDTDEQAEGESSDNVLDFETGSDGESGTGDETMEISLDVPDQGDETMELDTGTIDSALDADEPDSGLEFDAGPGTEEGSIEPGPGGDEEEPDGEDTGLDFDLGIDEDDSADPDQESIAGDAEEKPADIGLEISLDDEQVEGGVANGVDLDLSMEDDAAEDAGETTDGGATSDETIELQKDSGLSLADYDDDEDEDERTVFVPKTPGADEQSSEDEIATKLDLAKAYVELGDSENARSILDEVIANGNSSQQKQAEQLLNQLS